MESRSGFSLLYKACSLLVALCALHISIMLLFYLRDTSNQNQHLHPRPGNIMSPSLSPSTSPSPSPSPSTSMSTRPTETSTSTSTTRVLKKCPDPSPLLVGPLRVEFSEPVNLTEIRLNPRLIDGGRYSPSECVSLQKVALIIPFRKREEHLNYWLYYLHPILQRQQLDYGVYVIQQDGMETFNRAKLLNVGFVEALKEEDYDCFVFSDVDLIPMDDRNIYRCYDQPRHLAVSMDKFGFRLPYNQYFGGVSAMSKEQYLKINGFPNNYWGWGGEDDDIYNRLTFRGMYISRTDGVTGRCKMIRHERDKMNEPNPQRFERISHTRETMDDDGVNTLQYEVMKVEKNKLFTRITVNIGKP